MCGVCVVEGVWMYSLSKVNGHKCTRMLSMGMGKSKYGGKAGAVAGV